MKKVRLEGSEGVGDGRSSKEYQGRTILLKSITGDCRMRASEKTADIVGLQLKSSKKTKKQNGVVYLATQERKMAGEHFS